MKLFRPYLWGGRIIKLARRLGMRVIPTLTRDHRVARPSQAGPGAGTDSRRGLVSDIRNPRGLQADGRFEMGRLQSVVCPHGRTKS